MHILQSNQSIIKIMYSSSLLHSHNLKYLCPSD